MHLYIDIGDIPQTGDNVRDFMVGFMQNQPLFSVMDVGHDSETLLRRMKGTCDSSWNVLSCMLIL